MDSKKMHEKKLDGNYARMLHAISSKSWKQKHKTAAAWSLLFHLTNYPTRRTRHMRHCRRSKDKFISDILILILAKADPQGLTCKRSVRTLNVVWSCQVEYIIRVDGKRESGKFVFSARLNDDEDDGDGDKFHCCSYLKIASAFDNSRTLIFH